MSAGVDGGRTDRLGGQQRRGPAGPRPDPRPGQRPGGPPWSALPDLSVLRHPWESSRFVLAVVGSGVAGLIALIIVIKIGYFWSVVLAIAFFFGLLWIAVQVHRARLLGEAVEITAESFPLLNGMVEEARRLTGNHQPVGFYVRDKTGGKPVDSLSYLGTRVIVMEGSLVADLTGEASKRPQLTFLLCMALGALRARHDRLQPLVLLTILFEPLKFLNLILNPHARATIYTGDQIAVACGGDLSAGLAIMGRLLLGKELAPQITTQAVVTQHRTVRESVLPRLAHLPLAEPYLTRRYVNLLAFCSWYAPQTLDPVWAQIDEHTRRAVYTEIQSSPYAALGRRA